MHRPICTHTIGPKRNPLPKDIYFEGPSRQKPPKPNLILCNPGISPPVSVWVLQKHILCGSVLAKFAIRDLHRVAAEDLYDLQGRPLD